MAWFNVIISVYFRFASVEAEQAMETLAMTDPLTRLANRRRMRDLLEVERVRYQRNQRPFAVIVADVDDFKKVNDQQGHDRGDHVLMHVANLMRAVVRAQDCIARWGGEEFLFLLPDTDLEARASSPRRSAAPSRRATSPSSASRSA